MKRTLLVLSALAFYGCKEAPEQKEELAQERQVVNKADQDQSLHQFVVKDITGNDFNLSDLEGKKVMIVNTASKCGLTPQYKELQELYEMYGAQGFTIIGFPANNFGGQEPGSDEEIAEFCSLNYGVSFPMMSKISVKGEDMHPVYRFLTQKEHNGLKDSEVKWNFQKYLIDEEGKLVDVISPQVHPTDRSITDWITKG